MEETVRAICRQAGIRAGEVQALSGGQVNKVYLVDDTWVVRVGTREGASQRLEQEARLLRHLNNTLPVPEVLAYGFSEGVYYQVQRFKPGKKLHAVWKALTPGARDEIVSQLAACLKALHREPVDVFGISPNMLQQPGWWLDSFRQRFYQILDGYRATGIYLPKAVSEPAVAYVERNLFVLEEATPAFVHKDLWMGNILVDGGQITALLDFEYALPAPADYELLKMEDFCLYPNDYAEEEDELYCAADFADFFHLLRRHYPALFSIPHLRKRTNLYHIASALHDYLAWRKDNLATIPASSRRALNFINARIANFTFIHGARMFYGEEE